MFSLWQPYLIVLTESSRSLFWTPTLFTIISFYLLLYLFPLIVVLFLWGQGLTLHASVFTYSGLHNIFHVEDTQKIDSKWINYWLFYTKEEPRK